MKRFSNSATRLLVIACAACLFGGDTLAQEAAPPVPTGQSPAAIQPAPSPTSNPISGSIPGPLVSPLSPGDVIDFSVYGVPEMAQRVRLNSKGVVYLPLLDQVELGGLTTEEAQKKLEEQLVSGGFLRAPHVTVTVAEYANGISLLGEVNRPGVYPTGGARRLYDVFAAAGGLTASAGNLVTISHSKQPDKSETVLISRDPSKSPEGNVLVSPGDTVVVAKAGIIYVVGEVIQPSGFLMDGDGSFTVLKAIAMAHGLSSTAKRDNVKIIRKEAKGLTEIPVPLSKIMSAKANDIELLPDDIVFVPSNAAKAAGRRTLDTAISLITGVTMIRATRP